MDFSQLAYIAVLGGIFTGMYLWRQRRIRSEGGMQGVLDQAFTVRFGLLPDEKVQTWWRAFAYLGPLVPATQHGIGEKVFDAAAGLTVRGLAFHLALTNQGRLVVAREPAPEERAKQRKQSLGDDGFRPFAAYGQRDLPYRPYLVPAQQVFGDAPALHDALARPEVDLTTQGSRAPYDLAVLLGANPHSQQVVLWVEPGCGQTIAAWRAQGAPA